jgi:ABC-type sugar transport system substrate-binding protein
MLRKIGIFLVLLLLAVPGGCRQGSKKAEKITLAAIFFTGYNPFFSTIERGLRETAENNQVNLIVLDWKELRRRGAKDVFTELDAHGVKAFLVMPETAEKAVKYCIPLVSEANCRAIPVIFLHNEINREIMKEHRVASLCTVSCDNRKGGELAAGYIAKKLDGSGKVLVIEGHNRSYPSVERRAGYEEVLRNYPGISVERSPDVNWQRQRSMDICRGIFKKERDVRAVLAFNELMAVGAYEASVLAGIPRPVIIGMDGTENGVNAVREGRIDATVDLSPYEIGKVGVESALKALKGEALPEHIFTSTRLVTPETLNRPFK